MQSFLDQLARATTIEWFSDIQKHRLRIAGGAHAGAEKKVVLGSVSFGSASGNDIVLFGDELEPHHFSIKRAAGFPGRLVVEAHDGPVTLEGTGRLGPGESSEARGSLRITADGASIIVERAVDPTVFAMTGIKAMLALVAVIAVSVGLNLAISFASEIGSKMVPKHENMASDEMTMPGGAMNKAVDGMRGTHMGDSALDEKDMKFAKAVVWAVRMKLEKLGLNYLIRATTTPDATIRVYGSVPPSKEPPWGQFLLWYDEQHGFPKLVREVVRSQAEAKMPSLQSVWMGDVPMAHFSDGNSATAGDSISDGWKVVSITTSAVVLERDGSKVQLNF